ncbi:hypothetical protein [Heyndrickxia oleronia]|jgi:hypothetical protein|uniref:hypothetical protein n=1 Tax=Heyndrickxia oleronia TaxID=38875 RepID=UPI0024302CBF|nr:hypothetical protein [Heyndrickxia oleronia]MCI1590378.1 hypothetical protein [Heyndrickxia oleronia]MCI1611360.1 hypothetical protein [Heyndrickxia oleronia]MCI1742803.1 hypothetical protein [Heyndrickxia oleronia]MCI1763112.1 hypothetical protein [Heyndrickxia oleronia]
MFFKNKSTGLVWEVEHPDHIKRCKNDSNYEEVKITTKAKNEPKQIEKEESKKSSKKK